MCGSMYTKAQLVSTESSRLTGATDKLVTFLLRLQTSTDSSFRDFAGTEINESSFIR